jgi:hypothetical protein
MEEEWFSPSYQVARRRFVDAADALGAVRQVHPIAESDGRALTIDVVALGPAEAPALVVSSGIHGAEGFFGSAVQLALLERLAAGAAPDALRYVLIHALNPFGFDRLRRANEDNVDLNRNFQLDPAGYQGAPAAYARLDGLLNPASPPMRLEPFRLRAAWLIRRMGLPALTQAVAGGQYAFPRGLFYGGQGPCRSTRVVQAHCDDWLPGTAEVLHIDLHTGLGAFGDHALLLGSSASPSDIDWCAAAFGAWRVESPGRAGATAYRVSGLFGDWMQAHFRGRDYRFLVAEFGTYDFVRVLKVLRAENRAHHYGSPDSRAYRRAKAAMHECFCPASTSWRRQVVRAALDIIEHGVRALKAVP